MDNKLFVFCAVILFSLFLMFGVFTLTQKSITNDELAHISAGYSYLKTGDFRMNTEHPPLIKIISAIPLFFLNPRMDTDHPSWVQGQEWEFGAEFLYFQNNNTDQLVFWARIPMILIGILLGVYVLLFARDLFGKINGLFALFFYVFSPNILAHTTLVTTDVGLACFSTMMLYHVWWYMKTSSRRSLYFAGVGFGLAMASKFSAVYFIPSIIAIFVIHRWNNISLQSHSRENLLREVISFATLISIGVLVVVVSYGLVGVGAYVEGFQEVVSHSQRGHNAYLFGEHSPSGFWQYFPFAFLIKTPLPFLMIILLLIRYYPSLNHKLKEGLLRDSILLIPVIIFLVLSMMSKINIGLRHILPVYPLLFIWTSQMVKLPWSRVKKGIVFGLLLIYFVYVSVSISPHYLAYFNELSGGPENGYKFLIDSNLDWGQDLKLLGRWVNEHNIGKIKMAYFGKDSRSYRNIEWEELKCSPESGILAVSVNRLVGLDAKSAQCLEWLRKFEPVKTMGYSIFVYNLSQKSMEVPLRDHCKKECGQKCEQSMQIYAQSVYNGTCICRCSQIT